MNHPDIDPAAVLNHPAVAGLAGALVGLKFAPGATWHERLFSVAAGAAISVYAGPITAEQLALTSEGARMGLGFGLGMFGITIADVLARTIRDLKLGEIISSKLGGGTKP